MDFKKNIRYSVKKTTSGNCSIYDSLRNCTILTSVSPQARYNEEVANKVCDLLNKNNN